MNIFTNVFVRLAEIDVQAKIDRARYLRGLLAVAKKLKNAAQQKQIERLMEQNV